MTTVSTIKPMIGDWEKSRTRLMKYDERMMIDTFTRLFDMSIVARRYSGFWRSRSIFWSRESLPLSISSRSCGESEKNATSEAETKADMLSRMMMHMMHNSAVNENGCTMTDDNNG